MSTPRWWFVLDALLLITTVGVVLGTIVMARLDAPAATPAPVPAECPAPIEPPPCPTCACLRTYP